MPVAYIDCFDFIRNTSGLEYQSIIGNMARFTSVQATQATSLSTTPGPTVPLNQFDRITIFDGAQTEVVQVGAAGAGVGATSIPLLSGTSLQYAHGVGVAWCSDGVLGSLADQIVDASAWLERICYQTLFQKTYTTEQLAMPTMRAAFDTDGQLTFRPRHWPVNSISGIAVAWTPTLIITYDPTQAFIDGNSRLVSVPNLVMLPGQQVQNTNLIQSPSRSRKGQVQVTYQAGYTYSAIPGDLKEAASLLTSDILAKRLNPVGAPDVSSGGMHISAVLRGDNSGESLLVKRALKILERYKTSMY